MTVNIKVLTRSTSKDVASAVFFEKGEHVGASPISIRPPANIEHFSAEMDLHIQTLVDITVRVCGVAYNFPRGCARSVPYRYGQEIELIPGFGG